MMPEVSLVGVLIVAAALAVPLALGLLPALRIPSVVEIRGTCSRRLTASKREASIRSRRRRPS